ncbi:hypothetical protein, partial [Pseudomonas viridiflava]|uniref:hypothetical protein n=1 Tax=Pseudomonas viridiflava TaxID=33069 RepID=UPI00197F4FD3
PAAISRTEVQNAVRRVNSLNIENPEEGKDCQQDCELGNGGKSATRQTLYQRTAQKDLDILPDPEDRPDA